MFSENRFPWDPDQEVDHGGAMTQGEVAAKVLGGLEVAVDVIERRLVR